LSSIRLTYAGIMGLSVRLSTLVTGLMFSVLVTRNLSIDDFGLYSLIGSLIAYAMFGHIIAGFWITRHIARGENVGKIGILSNGLFAIIGTIAYLIAAYLVAQTTDSDLFVLTIGGLILPLTYISGSLDSVNAGFRPQAVSYTLIAFEIAKVPFGYAMLEGYEIGLLGAILATIFALIVKIIFGAHFAWSRIKLPTDFSFFKRWLKLAWLPLYRTLATNIFALDILIVSIFFASTEPIAYYAAAVTISAVAIHSVALTEALTPKLIADTKHEHVRTILRLFSLLGIPLFAAVIVFAKPLLFLLNPAYSIAIVAVYLMSMRSLVVNIYRIFASILEGIEKVDKDAKATFSQYRKSNLFVLGTLQYIRTAVYISLLLVLLSIAKINDIPVLDIVVLWTFISLLSEISVTIYAGYLAYKTKFLSFDWKPTVKYAGIAILAAIISYYSIEEFVTYERDLVIFLPGLIVSLIIGSGVYLTSLFFIDAYFRSLLKSILFRK